MVFKFDSLLELIRFFKDEKMCFEYLGEQMWAGNPACPHCGSIKVYTGKTRSKSPAKIGVSEYRCAEKGCSKTFTATVGTIFEGSKLPLQTWFAAIWLATTTSKGISSLNLSKQLGITQKSAWFVLSRIREMFKETEPKMLSGTVEVDETYVGGKNKYRHANKKHDKSQSGDDKIMVMGLVQRDGKLITQVMPNKDFDTMRKLVFDRISPDAQLITDAHNSYKTLHEFYPNHVVVKTDPNNFITDRYFHTNNIEGYWAILKRGIYGVYHQVSRKHAQRYCDEFSYRYNTRSMVSKDKFAEGIRSVTKARITYKTLIGKETPAA